MKLVELYFTDPKKPPGQRFLGAVLMDANLFSTGQDAIPAIAARAWKLNVNPGGQLIVYDLDSKTLKNFTVSHLDKLLTEQECFNLNLFQKK